MDAQGQDGLMQTYRRGWQRRGIAAYLIAILLTAFYFVLYFSEYLSPFAKALGFQSKWYLYGALYSAAMIGGAVRYLRIHGNSRYNQVRICVNVLVQLILAFALPFVMYLSHKPDLYFSYLWPLKIEYLFPQTLRDLPVYFIVYSVVAALVLAPLLALIFGKRWYCSWVCGCGGLANTFGDPWRHLTSKSAAAWRFEKISVHSVLVIALCTTAWMILDFFSDGRYALVHNHAVTIRRIYGFVVGAMLAGVVGVGVYPIWGPRIWCRHFCPMAAVLGLIQKAGRFQIRVKPDMCISCGNCSTYCEMGIDVRLYAERNESFTRASCVGCGMCAHLCPRGVLRLEQKRQK